MSRSREHTDTSSTTMKEAQELLNLEKTMTQSPRGYLTEHRDERFAVQNGEFGVWSIHDDASDTRPSSNSSQSFRLTPLLAPIPDEAFERECGLADSVYAQEEDTIGNAATCLSQELRLATNANEPSDLLSGPFFDHHRSQDLRTPESARNHDVMLDLQPGFNLSSHLNASAQSSSIAHLMEHYRVIAGTFFSPRRTSKLPWVIMHLPSARSTLAKIAAGEKTTFVQTAILNAVLSISASNLDTMTPSKHIPSDLWWVLGQSYRSHGKLDMQKHLSLKLSDPDTDQYAETLMALLTMASASIIGGQFSEVRPFLLDAETWICRYGKKQPTSRFSQINMLHQIFLFQRVIEESTFVYPQWAECGSPTQATLDGHAQRYPSLQTVYFARGVKLPESLSRALEAFLRDTDSEDAHAKSTFEEIYGIPESLLSLISKTTSLSNEIRASRAQISDQILDPEFAARSKALETDILRWRMDELGINDTVYTDSLVDLDCSFLSTPHGNETPEEGPIQPIIKGLDDTIDCQPSTYLNLATHHGLLIYFYRRISNLDASLLQFHVDAIMKLLRYCRHEMVKLGIINCGIVWPGFLAAAEALGRSRQASIRSFLRDSACISGMRSFDVAMDVAEEVWRQRMQKGNAEVSWVDILADQGRTVILT